MNTILSTLSWNIRSSYSAQQDGPNRWELRKDCLCDLLQLFRPEILGLQEVLHHQLQYIQARLPDYDFVGVGREDGQCQGEYVPLFYRRQHFQLLDSGTFWLAPAEVLPEKSYSPAWDAACVRIATWVILGDLSAGNRKLFCLNTHWDHAGIEARHQSARLILQKIAQLAGNLPMLIMGDFNAEATEPSSCIFHQGIADLGGHNAAELCRSQAKLVFGQDWSFHDFGRLPLEQRPTIDYIYTRGCLPETFASLNTSQESRKGGLLWASDHSPLLFRWRFAQNNVGDPGSNGVLAHACGGARTGGPAHSIPLPQ